MLYRLHQAGYQAYLVGGCVRDLLLNLHPKDFDVVTDAHPEQIKRLFDNCRLIGRRFRLAHVLYGRDVIEVATFRARLEDEADPEDDGRHRHQDAESGRIMRDNIYGTLEQDVWRRDFTINALYYNIADFSLVDYVGGLDDINKRTIRLIGDPEIRYREDPVRMLRAVRFAVKLGFTIDPGSAEPIRRFGHLLADIPPARLFDEVLKLFHGGHAAKTFDLLREYSLLQYIFPATARCLANSAYPFSEDFIRQALANTDTRIAEGKPVTPAFLYAALLWLPLLRELSYEPGGELPGIMDIQTTASEVLHEQAGATAVPRRFTLATRDIWSLQPRLQRYSGKRALTLLDHPRFRAGYDFLVLRAQVGEAAREKAQWWTEIQEQDPANRQRLVASSPDPNRQRRRRRRRGGVRKPKQAFPDAAH